jgi:serine/threonine protein kinase
MDEKQQRTDSHITSAARDQNNTAAPTEALPTVAASSQIVPRMGPVARGDKISPDAAVNTDLPIPLGSVVKHRFVLDQVLGRGGMGCVYRALDLRKKEARDADPYIAIKVLSGAISKQPDAFIALQRETRKTQTLAHPNIVTVYDFDRDGNTVFMTMEALRGVSLDKYIKAGAGKKIDRKKALAIIRGIAVALAYAHSRGFVHSDLKPSNIILTETDRVKVLDLGIARAMTQDQHGDAFETGKLHALTPRYASTEMFRQAAADPRDDIYALGLIACQLLGGPHAYLDATSIQALAAETAPVLPKSTGFFLRRLLRDSVQLRTPARPANGTEFLRRLDFALNGYKKLAAALILLAAIGAGNGIYWSVFSHSAPMLSDLPSESQRQFHRAIAEADSALAAGALDGALYYLDAAYTIQKTDREIYRLRTTIVATLKQRAAHPDGSLDRQMLQDAVQTLQQYPVFSASAELQKLTEL